jgi:CelD/BcsL family acetyltransferase involved in cellulose biosynthesis
MTETDFELQTRPPAARPSPPAAAPRVARGAAAARDVASLEAGGVELAVHHDLAAVGPLWRDFEIRANRTFFQSFAWLEAWQRHVGATVGVVPAVVTGSGRGGTTLFILPLAISPRGPARELTFLGSELCDYNAPLLHPQFDALLGNAGFAELWPRILARLKIDPRFAFDVVNLVKMPETVGAQPNPLLALGTHPNPSGAYATQLGDDWEALYQRKRSSSTRKKERQQLRQLGEFGEIRFVDALEGDERGKTLDVLFAQKAQSFARMGVGNIFTKPGHRELFTAFVLDPANRHLVHLSRLEVGDTIAAASIGFTAAGCYALVLSSYTGGDMAKVGPGRVHLQELLRYAIRNGFALFDFSIGDEAYKKDWSDGRLTLHDHLSAASWRGAIAVALIRGFATAKRTIKQNPTLWRLFSRARALRGRLRASPARVTGTTPHA